MPAMSCSSRFVLVTLSLLYQSGLGFQVSIPQLPQQQQQPLCSRQQRFLALGSTTDEDQEPSTLDWSKLSKGSRASDPQDFFQISKEDEGDDEEAGNVHIPPGGFSVSDQIDANQRDRFVTQVVPIDGLRGVAQLYTAPIARAAFEPVRYLIATTAPTPTSNAKKNSTGTSDMILSSATSATAAEYVMMDVPPYSPQLVAKMKAFMGPLGSVKALLMTSRDNIHYDDMPGVFVARRADLDLWRKEFPAMNVVSYRLDTPRDCRPLVTQVLDGYGPFAMLDNGTFVETGRPLTYDEWSFDTADRVMSGQQTVPPVSEEQLKQHELDYSLEAIRRNEEGRRVLAVYTPGHTFGSVSYVFPEQEVVASGYTIPVEDTRLEENLGDASSGPALDCRGYITTNRAGVQRQMESARRLIAEYIDRFKVVLPSRGDPLFLDDNVRMRTTDINEIVDQYDRIGQIYEQLGIMSGSDDEGY